MPPETSYFLSGHLAYQSLGPCDAMLVTHGKNWKMCEGSEHLAAKNIQLLRYKDAHEIIVLVKDVCNSSRFYHPTSCFCGKFNLKDISAVYTKVVHPSYVFMS